MEVFLPLFSGMKLNPEMLIICPEFLANYGDKEIDTVFNSLPGTVLHYFHTYSHLILVRALNEVNPVIPILQEKLNSLRLVTCSGS